MTLPAGQQLQLEAPSLAPRQILPIKFYMPVGVLNLLLQPMPRALPLPAPLLPFQLLLLEITEQLLP